MSGASASSSSRTACVDKSMESVPGGEADSLGGQFWHMVGECSGLGCPPYKHGRELNCVVCTK